MRLHLTAAVVFGFCLAGAQDSHRTIAYTTKAEPLRVVLQEISRQTGTRLEAANALENEPLILRLNAVPLKETMDRIADVFAADWVQKKDVYILERSPDRAARARAQGHAEKVAAIQASIDHLLKLADDGAIKDAATADQVIQDFMKVGRIDEKTPWPIRKQFLTLYARMPSTRLAAAALNSIGAEQLSRFGPYDHVFFSSEPNAAQAPVHISAEDLERFSSTHQLLLQEFKRLFPQPDYGTVPSGLGADLLPGDAEPGKIIVSFDWTHSMPLGRDMRITIIGKDGKPLGNYAGPFDADYSRRLDNESEQSLLRAEQDNEQFTLSPVAREIERRVNIENQETLRALPETIIDQLLSPSNYEPLSFATSDIILKSAELHHVNAVCLAPDDAEAIAYQSARGGKTSWESFCAAMRPLAEMSLSIKDGWLVGKPFDPEFAQACRVPRPLLEKILRRAFEAKHLSIDDVVEMRVGLPRDADLSLEWTLGCALIGGNGCWSLFDDVDILRLLSTLSDAQRSAIKKNGLRTAVSGLLPEQQAIVEQFVFSTNDWIHAPEGQEEDNSLTHEITSILPNGLPANAPVKLKETSTPMLYVTMPNTELGSEEQPQDFESAMVILLASEQHPELLPQGFMQPVRVALGEQRFVQLEVGLNDKQERVDQVSETYRLPGPSVAPRVLLKTLAPELRKKLLDRCAKYISQHQNSGDSGAPVNPPRPPF